MQVQQCRALEPQGRLQTAHQVGGRGQRGLGDTGRRRAIVIRARSMPGSSATLRRVFSDASVASPRSSSLSSIRLIGRSEPEQLVDLGESAAAQEVATTNHEQGRTERPLFGREVAPAQVLELRALARGVGRVLQFEPRLAHQAETVGRLPQLALQQPDRQLGAIRRQVQYRRCGEGVIREDAGPAATDPSRAPYRAVRARVPGVLRPVAMPGLSRSRARCTSRRRRCASMSLSIECSAVAMKSAQFACLVSMVSRPWASASRSSAGRASARISRIRRRSSPSRRESR